MMNTKILLLFYTIYLQLVHSYVFDEIGDMILLKVVFYKT